MWATKRGKRRAAGDPAASFRAVYEEHFAFVWRTLRRLGVDAGDVADATQEVFVVVHRKLRSFEGRATLRTWLFQIAKHVALHHHRAEGRRDRRLAALAQVDAERTDSPARVEAPPALHGLLAQLDVDQRDVFVLSRLEGMTTREVALALGLKEPTVYSRLQAARRRLEKLVAESGGDDGLAT